MAVNIEPGTGLAGSVTREWVDSRNILEFSTIKDFTGRC